MFYFFLFCRLSQSTKLHPRVLITSIAKTQRGKFSRVSSLLACTPTRCMPYWWHCLTLSASGLVVSLFLSLFLALRFVYDRASFKCRIRVPLRLNTYTILVYSISKYRCTLSMSRRYAQSRLINPLIYSSRFSSFAFRYERTDVRLIALSNIVVHLVRLTLFSFCPYIFQHT